MADRAIVAGKSLLVMALVAATNVGAFKLAPEGSFIEAKLASRSQTFAQRVQSRFVLDGISVIGKPVHEEITNRSLGCIGDADLCAEPTFDPKYAYIISGVRWNDDPPFKFERRFGAFTGCDPGAIIRLVTYPVCWASIFSYGEKAAARGIAFGPAAPVLLRSHFGDLQFLHSMASRDGESPTATRNKIMMWAEFTWRVVLREFPLSLPVRDVPIAGLSAFFSNRSVTIGELFGQGNPHIRNDSNMSDVAFGSLLHMVQDSFSMSHVERAPSSAEARCRKSALAAPGAILEFHSYPNQDPERHGKADERDAFSGHWSLDKPNVVDIGHNLSEMFTVRASWATVKPYLECIYALDREAREASPGERFVRSE